MATFKSHYTTSELLKVLDRHSLIHYYWTKNNGEYTFYFIDNRRLPRLKATGVYRISCHKANYYRLRNKINFLPFRLGYLTKYGNNYSFDLLPDSSFIYDCAGYKLTELNISSDGNLIVNVVVI